MKTSKLVKYIKLALNNSSEAEAQSAARMFFKRLTAEGISFNPAVFGITRGEAAKLATLAGKIFKGLNDGQVKPEVKPTPKAEPKAERKAPKRSGMSNKDLCYDMFKTVNMSNGAARRAVIDMIVREFGFNKASVQSYASNFRKEFEI
ncbi:hypothetical protein [Escherichia phage P479]|nr:hypothetical protein [Escherichia phage P479]UIS66123.1 hypothetical protein [Escherichia phage PSD2001]